MSLATIKHQTPVTTTTTPTLHRPTIFIIQPYRALIFLSLDTTIFQTAVTTTTTTTLHRPTIFIIQPYRALIFLSLDTTTFQTAVTTTTTPTLHRRTIFIIQPLGALMYHKQAEDKIVVTGYYKRSDTSNNFNTHTTPTYHLHHPALQSSDVSQAGGG